MIKLIDLYEELLSDTINDSEHNYHRYIKPIEKLLNVKIKNYIQSGTRGSIFETSDNRILKITNDSSDAAGLKYAMDNYPNLPLLRVFEVCKYKVGSDAYGEPFYVYISISEKVQSVKPQFIDNYIDIILKWFDENTNIQPRDVHGRNIGISVDKSTPLDGLIILDPSFKGMTDSSNIKIIGN